MPPIDFKDLAKGVFDEVKHSLSTDAIYIPKSGGQFPVRGPFDDRVQEVDPETQVVISSNRFSFGLKLDDIPEPPEKGDTIIISDITYIVIEPREDGVPEASVALILHREGGQ